MVCRTMLSVLLCRFYASPVSNPVSLITVSNSVAPDLSEDHPAQPTTSIQVYLITRCGDSTTDDDRAGIWQGMGLLSRHKANDVSVKFTFAITMSDQTIVLKLIC